MSDVNRTAVRPADPPLWADVIPADIRNIYTASGYGRRAGLGASPVLLVVDATYGFVGERGQSAAVSALYPKSSGPSAWAAMEVLEQLLPEAREAGIPVIYSRNPPREGAIQAGGWARKTGSVASQGARQEWEIVDEILPEPGDLVLEKTKPSAFFATPLASWLVELGADTVLVAGGTTSGCVRASAVDAFSYNFRVGVVADATFDRAEVVHKVNLFDLDQKYGDVLDAESLSPYLLAIGSR